MLRFITKLPCDKRIQDLYSFEKYECFYNKQFIYK